jgi:hypothetical protein
MQLKWSKTYNNDINIRLIINIFISCLIILCSIAIIKFRFQVHIENGFNTNGFECLDSITKLELKQVEEENKGSNNSISSIESILRSHLCADQRTNDSSKTNRTSSNS